MTYAGGAFRFSDVAGLGFKSAAAKALVAKTAKVSAVNFDELRCGNIRRP